MSECALCGKTIIFGGAKDGELRFCNKSCLQNAKITIEAYRSVPTHIVQEAATKIRKDNCPTCGGRGPVDVFYGYRVYSLLVQTVWQTIPRICCRKCGTNARIKDCIFSFLFGWWGFPWGFVMTPVQIGRNLMAMASSEEPSKPSTELEKVVRRLLVKNKLDAPRESNSQG